MPNKHFPRKQRYTSHKMYQAIHAEGYAGSESTVRGYVGQQRRDQKRPVYLPLEFDPGTDAQVDWGEGEVILTGGQVSVQLFLMRLCYSRRVFAQAYPAQKQEAFPANGAGSLTLTDMSRPSIIFKGCRSGSPTII